MNNIILQKENTEQYNRSLKIINKGAIEYEKDLYQLVYTLVARRVNLAYQGNEISLYLDNLLSIIKRMEVKYGTSYK